MRAFFDSDSIAVLGFRAAYQLYAAVDARLQRLRQQELDPVDETLSEMVRLISRKCLRELVVPKERSLQAFLAQISRSMNNLIQDFGTQEHNQLVVPILEEVRNDLQTPLPPEACRDGMIQCSQTAWEHLGNLVSQWGGPLARKRLTECGAPKLVFEINNRTDREDLSYPITRRSEGQIAWFVGHRPPNIEAFFEHQFYFLHEYLSHIFHTWDDVDPTLAETYLLRLAHLFLDTRPDIAEETRDPFQRLFLSRDFEALRLSNLEYERTEARFTEVFMFVGRPFLTFLLEWATRSPGVDNESREKCKLAIRAIYRISNRSEARAIFSEGPESAQASWNPSAYSFQTIYARLVSFGLQQQALMVSRLDELSGLRQKKS